MNRDEFEDQVTEERGLRAGLESLREAYSREEASSSTEEKLLAKFREANSAPRRLAPTWAWWSLAAAAVLLVCAFGVWLAFWPTVQPQSARQPLPKPVAPERVTAEQRIGRTLDLPERVPTDTKRHAGKHAANPVAKHVARRAPDSGSADGDAFIPTMFPIVGDADYGLSVVRVELPRRTMMSFGLRVDSRELNRPVKADLIIGPDGLTRAIRFVQ